MRAAQHCTELLPRLVTGRTVFAAAAATAMLLGGPAPVFPQEAAATYGSRLPPVPPGQGGDLVVTAPVELCADNSYELQIRRHVRDQTGSGFLYVLREPAGPSPCRWEVNGVRSASYDALIRRRGDDQIVAMASVADVAVGGLSELRVEFSRIDLAGTITVDGEPASNFQLYVNAGEGFNDWRVPIRDDGSYNVTLTGSDAPASFCMWLESARTKTIGGFPVGVPRLVPGLNRFDADVHLPPGVIRVEALPFGRPISNDWTSLTIAVEGARPASSASFKATDGFHGEYLGAFGDYQVTIQTGPDHRILSRSVVTLSSDHPVGQVRLAIPIGSLGCNDGWWSAC